MSTKRMPPLSGTFLLLPSKTRNSLKVLLLAFFCVLAFLFHIWFRTKVLTSGYQVGRLRHDIAKLESQIISLGVEKNRVFGPDQLENLVQQYESRGLKLKSPQKSQMIYLSRERSNP